MARERPALKGPQARDLLLARLARNPIIFDMAQMNVSIPDKLKSWAEQRVAEGRYSSTSDYVRDLVRRDQEAEEKRRALQAAIDEGLASPVVDTSIDEIIARGRARHGLK